MLSFKCRYDRKGASMPAANKEYKDRLFSFLFGQEDHKDWTLSLYNAINHTNYTDPDAITINTIRQILYLGMHNDISFMIADDINLYEQQSTYSPNIPLRMLEYLGNLYERYIQENRLNKYGRARIQLPVPRLIMFYNGTSDFPEEQILKLSDAFPEGAAADIEVCVRMLNINTGKNIGLKDACKPLAEYSWIVESIRSKSSYADLSSAIDSSIREMPDSFVIKPFLTAHLAEVKGMLETEYDEQKAMELFRLEGWNEGHSAGREEGITEGRQAGIAEGRQAGIAEGIKNTISAYRECGIDDASIVSRIMEKYDLSAELAGKYVSNTEQ